MNIELRKVKSFSGMEGKGFNADLHVNGVRVAFLIDHGDGGALLFQWVKGKQNHQGLLHDWVMGKSIVGLGLAKTEDEVVHGTATAELFGQPHPRLEAYINHLVDAHFEKKRLGRLKKTQVVFEDAGETYIVKIRTGETRECAEARVMSSWPNARIM